MITKMTPIIQKLREFVEDGNDGTFGTVAMHGSSVIGGRVSALLAEIDTLTREWDEARERLAQWVSWGDRMASGHPDAPMASLDQEVRAVIANRYGMSVIVDAALTQGDA
jgi:hypothetical protein